MDKCLGYAHYAVVCALDRCSGYVAYRNTQTLCALNGSTESRAYPLHAVIEPLYEVPFGLVRNVIKTPLEGIEFVTALEICEHLINPMGVLSALPCDKLIASVPLSLWFAKAYRSKTDPWDRHFHEFEDWQFDWLLEKSGWEVKDSEKWTSPSKKIGIRPFLRNTTPRYYIVYAERHQQ